MRNKKLAVAITTAFTFAACGTDRETVLPQAPEAPSLETVPSAAAMDIEPGPSSSALPAKPPRIELEQFRDVLRASALFSVSGKNIAYDMSHNTSRQNLSNPAGGNGSSTIFGDFTAAGATITVITTFDAATLSGFDVLWLEEDFSTALSAAEKTDLAGFVSAGGGVII